MFPGWILSFLPFDWKFTDTNLTTSESGPTVMETTSVYYSICWHFHTTNMEKKQNTQNTQQNMLWNIVLTLTHNIAGLVDQKSIMDNSRLGEINTSIMFVTVRNPTVWAYIQLLRHINFHYKNK